MRESKVIELGKRIIHDICEVGVTPEEVCVTFEGVLDSLMVMVLAEKVTDLMSGGVVEEAEEVLKEAFGNVDQ